MSVISTPAMNCPFLLRGGSGHFSSIPIELEVYLRVLEQLSHIGGSLFTIFASFSMRDSVSDRAAKKSALNIGGS